jgi:hypothetical protein
MKHFQGFEKSALLFTKSPLLALKSCAPASIFLHGFGFKERPRGADKWKMGKPFRASVWLIPFTVTKKSL